MLSQDQNDLITRTGPGTPGGDLVRRYWQPVALAEELPVGGAPKPVKIMGEELVLFRGPDGKPALLGLRCPHRKTDLSYGRIEGGGLRCVYHGWLFGADGRCLEQPGEPKGSTFKDKIRHTAYPCREVPGLILAYLGPLDAEGQPPAVPQFPFFTCRPDHVFATKYLHECNYLQGNEGNIDPQHLSFLHRLSSNPELGFREFFEIDTAPAITVEEKPWGVQIETVREGPDGEKYIRSSHFIMPNLSAFIGGPLVDPRVQRPETNDGYSMNWHVPIDDVTHWKFAIVYRIGGPVDVAFQRRSLLNGNEGEYRLKRNARNRYLQDRAEMETTGYIGMGPNFYDHDHWATEAQGPIMDRTTENLGTTDRAIILMRKQLLKGIDDIAKGKDPLLVVRDPAADPVADFFTGSWVVKGDKPVQRTREPVGAK